MAISVVKYGVDRIPENEKEILRHREMPLIDILLEMSLSRIYREITYQYDTGIIAKHVNRPIVELVSKENHPRPTFFDTEVTCALAMEDHAKLWAVPDGFKETAEIVGLAKYGNTLTVMRGMIPQPVGCVGVFASYAPDYDSRLTYAVRIKEHEKFGLKDPFDGQSIFYTPTNVSSSVVESKSKMACMSHSVIAISALYREAINRFGKYFPDVNPIDYVEIVGLDISNIATGLLSDHADDLEYYVGQVGWWRFVNIETLTEYVKSHPECVLPFDFSGFNATEGIRFDLGENAQRKCRDVRTNELVEFTDDDDDGGVPPCEATVTIDYLVDKEDVVFKQRLTPYRAVVKFKTEDHSFIPDVCGLSNSIPHFFSRSILTNRKDLSGSSFYIDEPVLDNFTSSGSAKVTKNELVFYGVLVNSVKHDIVSANTTIDDIVHNRHLLVSYLKQHAIDNRFKWVGLTDLIRQHMPLDDRARFYGMAMEIIRIENNSAIVNDFTYRWLDGYVYLAYVGRINDIEITTDDVNRLRSKLVSPVVDGSKLPDLKRLKFIRNSEHQDETLYGWDWFYILEDGKYRKVKGYILTERESEGNRGVCPNQGARVVLRDPDGVETSLFIDAYRLSKGMVTTDALAPVGGIYQLDDYHYIQVIV